MTAYISVRNWRNFQHYDPAKRTPPWIKVYTELLDDEDYLQLTVRQRGILHGIWLLYAESRSKLGSNAARLGRRLGDPSVRRRDLDALEQAGFITFVASAALAEGYHVATPEVEVETETETPPTHQRLQETPEESSPTKNGRVGGDIEEEEILPGDVFQEIPW